MTTSQPSAQVYDHGQDPAAVAADIADLESYVETEAAAERESEIELALSKPASVANLVLLLGYILALWFQILDFNGRAREDTAIVVYFLAFALLITSGMIELSVDVFSNRLVGHGRYHSDSSNWNRVISSLFIVAGTLDIVAFVYWMRRDFDVEDKVLLISSYVLLIMAVPALYFQVMDIRKETWRDVIVSDRIDLGANIVVFVVSVMGVVLRHMDNSETDFGDATDKLELATVPIWLFTSVLYVATDGIRLQTGDH